MKKLFFFLFITGILFTSCSSDDSSGSQSVLLTKTISTYEDGTVETIHYNYNGNKLIGQTFDSGYSTVTYAGDLITKIEYFYQGELVQKNLYQYDSSQRLIGFKRYEYEGDGEYFTQTDYVYNVNGTVSYTNQSGNTSYPLYQKTGTFTLNSFGEIISSTDSNNYTTSYTYDDKKSPFINVLGTNKILFEDDNANEMIHNIIQETNDFSTKTSIFTYNVAGYPLTEVDTEEDEVVTTQYFYND